MSTSSKAFIHMNLETSLIWRVALSLKVTRMLGLAVILGYTIFPHVAEGSTFQSPDGRRVATFEYGVVSITDVSGTRKFDRIYEDVKFSPDSKRFAYVGIRDKRFYGVVDDREYGPFDNVGVEGVNFSPLGLHVAMRTVSGKKWSVWVDGAQGPSFDSVASPAYSGDEAKFGYPALHDSHWFVISEGKEYPAEDGVLADSWGFTATGVLYFAAKSGKEWRVHLGDSTSDAFTGIGLPGIRRSPNNKSIVYNALHKSGITHCIDLTCGPQFKSIGTFAQVNVGRNFWRDVAIGAAGGSGGTGAVFYHSTPFSPDGLHYAYIANDGDTKIVIDGKAVMTLQGRQRVDFLRFGAHSDVIVYRQSSDGHTILPHRQSADEDRPLFALVPGASAYAPPADAATSSATLNIVASGSETLAYSEALVYVDDRFAGFAPQTLRVSPGTRRVVIEQRGYPSQSRSVDAAPGSSQTLTFDTPPPSTRKIVQEILEKFSSSRSNDIVTEIKYADIWKPRFLAEIPYDEDILAVVPAPGDNAFVFGESGIYVRNDYSSHSRNAERFFLSYQDFAKAMIPPTHPKFEVPLTGDKSAVIRSFTNSKIIECLNELRQALKKM